MKSEPNPSLDKQLVVKARIVFICFISFLIGSKTLDLENQSNFPV